MTRSRPLIGIDAMFELGDAKRTEPLMAGPPCVFP